MLRLEPLSLDWSAAGAETLAVAFTAPASLPPVDPHIRHTPWSAFQRRAEENGGDADSDGDGDCDGDGGDDDADDDGDGCHS